MADETLTEEWRPIEGWPYEVSNLGRVRHRQWQVRKIKFRKTTGNRYGYFYVKLHDNGKHSKKYIAPLVCTVFHGPRPSTKHQAAHWDGDKSNNRASNLRWATSSEKSRRQDKARHHFARRATSVCAAFQR